jgi:glycosyltransferase involved in cell wall biosynthesis
MKCCLVIPCYNEAKRLAVARFSGFIENNSQVDFLFVNDGSKDDTFAILSKLQTDNPQRIKVLNLVKNSGKAEAVRQGMLAVNVAQYNYVGFWDADLAVPLSEFPRMAEIIQNKPQLFCLLASRVKLLGYEIVRKPLRHYLGRTFATAASLFLKMSVYDTQCGAKLFRAEIISELFSAKFRTHWIFDVEILLRFKLWYLQKHVDAVNKLEDYINEMPLLRWQDVDGSKVKSVHFLLAFWDFILLLPQRKNIKK